MAFRDVCVKKTHSGDCCRSWSLPNYVALLSNRSSCHNITQADVSKVIYWLSTSSSTDFPWPIRLLYASRNFEVIILLVIFNSLSVFVAYFTFEIPTKVHQKTAVFIINASVNSYYRPQTKVRESNVLHLSVSYLFTGRGPCLWSHVPSWGEGSLSLVPCSF